MPTPNIAHELNVLSWNVEDNLNDPNVQAEILATGCDIAIFPESVKEEEGVSAQTIACFEAAGYDVHQTRYNDDDGRKDRHILVMAVRKGLAEYVLPVRLGQDAERKTGRTALLAHLRNGADVLGVHFDDRKEERRQPQVRDAVGLLGTLGKYAVAMGDMNGTHFEGFWPKVLRSRLMNWLVKQIPAEDPDGHETELKLASWKWRDVREYAHTKVRYYGSLAQRLVLMALGTTMKRFTDAGFTDASPKREPTKVAGLFPPLQVAVQIDHIMHRGDIDVLQPTTLQKTRLSDHRRLFARLALRTAVPVPEFDDDEYARLTDMASVQGAVS